MFTKPIDEITFEDVKSFCKEWTESVRVEYKEQLNIKKQIPKIVSSFANYYGGLFLIGVKADKTKNEVIFPIQGIPQRNGIEEQIQQSALTGIYPGVIPEIQLVDVPNSQNVVVVVRVDESVQAPHAIEGSTRVYIRTGSITQPYKLSDIDRISHMLKRREDSQVVARQILTRIEERAKHNFPLREPTLTVTAQPVFPYRPVISTSDIFELYADRRFGLRRVVGGISKQDEDGHLELNEYGIVYLRPKFYEPIKYGIDCGEILEGINELIKHAKGLYDKCEYLGNIEISVQLQKVLGRILIDPKGITDYREEITGNLNAKPECFDTEVFASRRCITRDFENEEKRKDIVEELTLQVIWAFNVPNDNQYVKEKVRKRIEYIYHPG